MKKKIIMSCAAFFGVLIIVIAIGQALGIIKPDDSKEVIQITPAPTDTVEVTSTPAPETTKTTKVPEEPDNAAKESDDATKEVEKEKAIFEYYNSLIQSKDNPANWEKIGIEDYEIGTKEYKEALAKWNQQCEDYEKKVAKETAKKFGITKKEADDIFLKYVMGASSTQDTYSIEHGNLVETTVNGNTLIIKVKIEPLLTNKMTINQNYFNVEDIIKNQDGNKFDVIDYWAVADMQDGSEGKVISFTLEKDVIKNIYDGNIVANQIGNYVKDLWILPSLQE